MTYIEEAQRYIRKAVWTIESISHDPLCVAMSEDLKKYIHYADHQIDLIHRRVLQGEKESIRQWSYLRKYF